MVKMLQTAKYGGKQYEIDEEYSVDPKIERFWIKNGISEQSDTDLFDKPKPSKFDDMTDEQLAEYAEQMGVNISRVRSRAAAIAKIEKTEQGE